VLAVVAFVVEEFSDAIHVVLKAALSAFENSLGKEIIDRCI